jgi:hypothetical protein
MRARHSMKKRQCKVLYNTTAAQTIGAEITPEAYILRHPASALGVPMQAGAEGPVPACCCHTNTVTALSRGLGRYN